MDVVEVVVGAWVTLGAGSPSYLRNEISDSDIVLEQKRGKASSLEDMYLAL